LTHFADFEGNDHLTKGLPKLSKVSWDKATRYLQMDSSVKPCGWAKAGHEAAMARFDEFCQSKSGNGLKNFDSARNDPNHDDVCSNLSPWINYGQVSFQRLALDVRAFKKYSTGTAAYIEEGVVRRELSDNYVYYARDEYDSLNAAAGWARESLDLHEADEREYVYSLDEFDKAQTHDDLWNAAQLQLTREGGMHGFLRMYWAKKILEWTPNAATALRTGLYFNDRYALDGNDPNGFVGVGWSVMGIHDMGWKERPIFGKIRFMNYNGCKRKFKIPSFVAKYKGSAANADAAIKKHAASKKGTKRKTPC
jgi:deoxyribodipyrimidine photo-lyase